VTTREQLEAMRSMDISVQLRIELSRPADKWLMSCPELEIVDMEMDCGRAAFAAESAATALALRTLADRVEKHNWPKAVHRLVKSFRG
jgi:hypothetical protein